MTPVRGLEVKANGWARLPGRTSYSAAIDAENFIVSTIPWQGNPFYFDPVYTFVQFVCPFCDATGERNEDECPACSGDGEMQFDA